MERERLEQAPTLVKLRQGYAPVTQTRPKGVAIRPANADTEGLGLI